MTDPRQSPLKFHVGDIVRLIDFVDKEKFVSDYEERGEDAPPLIRHLVGGGAAAVVRRNEITPIAYNYDLAAEGVSGQICLAGCFLEDGREPKFAVCACGKKYQLGAVFCSIECKKKAEATIKRHESDFGTPAEQRRQECSDPCPKSRHEDGKHTWQFDGDDPYVICAFCGECRDALTGRTIPESPLNPSELWDKQGHDLIVRLGARVRELEAALAEWENGREGAWKDAARRLEAERDQLRARADYLNKVVNEAYAKIAVLKDSLADALNYRKFYRDEHKECERLRAIIVAALDANLDHDCGLEGHDQDCSECVLAKLLFDYVKERRDA